MERCRSSRSGVQNKSNKGERTLVAAAIHANEFALAEAHVRLKSQRRGGARFRVHTRPAPANMRQTHKPVKICDLRWIVDIGQRVGGIQRVMVDGNPKRLKRDDAPGNRIDQGATGVFAAVIVIAGKCRLWAQQTRTYRGARRATDQIAPG